MLGTVNILLRGIPFIYQGQEIGMQNEIWSNIHDYNDISTIDQYKLAREAGLSDAEALEVCGKMSRDNARTPVQWNAQANAGFTTGTPWLKVHSDYKEINVAAQEKDPDSVLTDCHPQGSRIQRGIYLRQNSSCISGQRNSYGILS